MFFISSSFESFRINKTLKPAMDYSNGVFSFESFRINKTLKQASIHRWPQGCFESFRINKTLKPKKPTRTTTRVLNPSVLTRLSNITGGWGGCMAVLNPSVLTRLSNLWLWFRLGLLVLNPSVLTRLSNFLFLVVNVMMGFESFRINKTLKLCFDRS